MKKFNRRDFAKVLGASSIAIAAGAMMPSVLSGHIAGGQVAGNIMAFRAIGGLPTAPKPTIVTYVLEGSLNLNEQSGVVTRTVYMGPPEKMSRQVLPGMSQIYRVTEARESADGMVIAGVADDRSQVRRGESPAVHIHIDRYRGIVRAPFLNSNVTLKLKQLQGQ